VTSKLYSDNKWTGVLTGRRDSYLDCLLIEEKKLDNLFEVDHKAWLKNLKNTKEDVVKKQKQLEALLLHQGKQLQNFLVPTKIDARKPI
jgi:hypothetical protein